MAERLADLQQQFAAHIRNPEKNPAPTDVEERRMAIYRDLFFRNLANFLAGNFPVLRQLYADDDWNALVRDFFTDHQCHTPLFPEIPREFLQYLQDQRHEHPTDPPFLLELAHYEWVELALDLDESDLEGVPTDPDGDLLTGIPVFSPVAWPLVYNWPVHEIRPDFRPDAAPEQPTHLLVYRDRADRVRFMKLNAVTSLLVHRLKEDSGKSGHDLLSEVAELLAHPNPEKVIEGGLTILEDLRRRDVVLGTRPECDTASQE